jgi:hypothetical protein
VLLSSWAAGLWRGYDPGAGRVTLPVIGARVSLGESEEEEHRRGAHRREHEEEEEDDD